MREDQPPTGELALTDIQARRSEMQSGGRSDLARHRVRVSVARVNSRAHAVRVLRRRHQAAVGEACDELIRNVERYLADAFGVILPALSVERIAKHATVQFIAPVYARQPRSINADALLSDADNEAIRQRQCMIARSCWAAADCGYGHRCSSDKANLARTEARDRHLVRRAFGTESSVDAVREALGALRSTRPLRPAHRLQYLAVTHFLDRLEDDVDEIVTFSWREIAEDLRSRELQYRLGPITTDSVRAAVEEFTRSMVEDQVDAGG